jgi:hypothetical protein
MESVNEAKAVWPGVQNLYVVQELLDQNKCVLCFVLFFRDQGACMQKKSAAFCVSWAPVQCRAQLMPANTRVRAAAWW